MKYLKSLIVLLVIITSGYTAKATHYMGGEITWVCIPTGQPNAGMFVFTLKSYRECGGITMSGSYTLNSNSPAGNIGVSLLPGYPKDLSPTCYIPGNVITCAGAEATGADNTGAVSEYVYMSAPVALNGVPPTTGWQFSWTSSNRNPSVNLNGTPGWTLSAKMYPYNAQNTYPCFDNSPTFSEVARSVIDAGYPFEYNHNAYDKELDSLHFEWGLPMVTLTNPVSYQPGYSYTSPLPGPAQNSNNVAGTVDPNTGTISFTSYTTGAFVTSTKVSAYRCGQLVAEIWRDIQVVLLAGGSNLPPIVNPPIVSDIPGAPNSFVDTVYAGEIVEFVLGAQDIQFLPGGLPQTMEIQYSSPQFGSYVPVNPPSVPVSTLSETLGCLQAPCATLTPAPSETLPLTGAFGLQTEFHWETSCMHLAGNVVGTVGCVISSNTYNFLLKVLDDNCPAPAINYSTITITILPKPFIDNPEIQCLSVLPNGDVSLEWSMKEDTLNSFDSYRVYYSPTQAGPYVEIDSIFDYSVLNYTHVGANASDSIRYYYVKTISGCPNLVGGIEADTFATIKVDVNFDNVNNNAEVSWNESHNPILESSTGWYQIYRKTATSGWEFVDSTQNTFFTEPMKQCDDDVFYYVTIEDTMVIDTIGAIPHNCISTSTIGKDLFYDHTEPAVPVISSVSVDNAAGSTVLTWDVSADGDVGGYIVYLLQAGGFTSIDTVFGINNNSYTDIINDPCDGDFNTYTVAAFDTCLPNISPYSVEHRTISLDVVKDICEAKNTLTWTSYINMDGGLSSYEVYASENGAAPVLLNTNAIGDTTYIHIGLNSGSTYTYYIVAKNTDGSISSTSCEFSVLSILPGQPKFVYLRKASVYPANINGVNLTIHTDTSAIVSFYRLERAEGALWTAIAALPPDNTNPTLFYNDATANVTAQTNSYRCVVVDSCGKEAITTLNARTILATATAGDSLLNHVSWTPYIGFDGTQMTYQVFRSVDGIWDWNPLITLPENQTFFIDDVTAFKEFGGVFNYVVAALEGPGVEYSFNDTVFSNYAAVVQKPRLYIPTAFNPNSVVPENRVFVPYGVFINSADYIFMVYNRWGDKVFEAKEVGVGWDGTSGDDKLPGGVYTYFVRFTASNGITFEDRGTVTLIR